MLFILIRLLLFGDVRGVRFALRGALLTVDRAATHFPPFLPYQTVPCTMCYTALHDQAPDTIKCCMPDPSQPACYHSSVFIYYDLLIVCS